ncbi:MAG: hypothetical protein JW837_18325 [Sedimentisphaerales bacterium]|nr:hypothetical protein [Sedimentisphaerales bacterium]
MKRTPFNRKYRVKFPVGTPGSDRIRALEKDARRLIKIIFRYLPCVVCRIELDEVNNRTVPHHLLDKGMYEKLRFEIWNLLPLCRSHHEWPHSNKKQEFLNWLLDNLPEHYRYYKNEKPKKSPFKPSEEQIVAIVERLEDLAGDPAMAERIIYEHD